MTSITGGFASLLGVPASQMFVTNVTDLATGQSLSPSRRLREEAASVARALAAAGSLGVSVSMKANLGKTPTQSDVTSQLASLSTLSPTSPLFVSIISSIATATGSQASFFTASVPSRSVSFTNLPFLVAPSTAPAAESSSAGSSTTGTIVGIVVVILFFVAVWSWRSWVKHGKLPCFRDRGAEKRAALAALAARNTAAEEGDLTVRTLASTVASLKAELAAKKALEIAERNAGSADARMTMSPLAKARAEAVAESAVAAAASEKRGQIAFAPNGVRS